MKEAVGLGGMLEFAYSGFMEAQRPFTAGDYATAIRSVGAEHRILVSDLGRAEHALPVDGLNIISKASARPVSRRRRSSG